MSPRLSLLLVLGATALLATPGARAQLEVPPPGTPCFELHALPVPDSGLDVADVNGDGWTDVVGVRLAKLQALLNNGHGRFDVRIEAESTVIGDALQLGDMDGDGRMDAVVGVSGTAGPWAIRIFRGDGLGHFDPILDSAMPPVTGLRLGDLDNDGALDVLACDDGSAGSISVLRGDGHGGLLADPAPLVAHTPRHPDLGDVDQDGRIDLAVARGQQAIDLYLNAGAASFDLAQSLGSSFDELFLPRFADTTGDGWLDLVVASAVQVFFVVPPGIDCLPNDGSGQILNAFVASGPACEALGVGDLDGDGRADAVTSDEGRLTAQKGLATGQFQAGAPHPAGVFDDITLADMDGDGALDAVLWGGTLLAEPRWVRGDGAGGFFAPDSTVVGGEFASISDVDFVDMDADGQRDLLYVELPVNTVGFLRGLGGDAYASTPVSKGVGKNPVAVDAGDLNGDGKLDVVVCCRGTGLGTATNDGVQVLLAGAGGFLSPSTLVTGTDPLDVALLDVDLDGDLDAVVANHGSDTLSVLAGNGAGALSLAQTVLVDDGPVQLATCDANLDGKSDVFACFDSNSIYGFYGNGTGGFVALFAQFLSLGSGAMAVGDLNGDERPDVVAGLHITADMQVTLSKPGGGFGPAQIVGNGDIGPGRLAVADLDGDGHADVVGGVSLQDALCVWPGDGAGGFLPRVFDQAPDLLDLALGDLDGDGDLDVLGGDDSGFVVRFHGVHAAAPWVAVGGGVSGVHGVPRLAGAGAAVVGSPISITLSHALSFAPVLLAFGAGQLSVPFKGGLFVPQPQLLLVGLLTDAEGRLELEAEWPAGLPSGLQLVLQAWLIDAAASRGYAGSGGLVIATP